MTDQISDQETPARSISSSLSKASLVLACVFSFLAGSAISKIASTEAIAETPDNDDVRRAFEARFVETKPDEITCEGFGPLCQVIAGKTVLYVDQDAEHAFIGRLYDLEEKRDLTEETLAIIRPDHADQAVAKPAGAHRENAPYANARQVSWDALPLEAAIIQNAGAPLKVAVFSDLNCGYCARFAKAMQGVDDIEISELLVGNINSANDSRAIGCTDDPAKALASYWKTRTVPAANCDTDIVTPAKLASNQLGIRGTPTFVRSDGAMVSGFYGVEELRAWLQEPQTQLATMETEK